MAISRSKGRELTSAEAEKLNHQVWLDFRDEIRNTQYCVGDFRFYESTSPLYLLIATGPFVPMAYSPDRACWVYGD